MSTIDHDPTVPGPRSDDPREQRLIDLAISLCDRLPEVSEILDDQILDVGSEVFTARPGFDLEAGFSVLLHDRSGQLPRRYFVRVTEQRGPRP